jgi:hypothetical protein
LSRLRLALARDVGRRHFIGWSLEAKLAAWELLHGATHTRTPEAIGGAGVSAAP